MRPRRLGDVLLAGVSHSLRRRRALWARCGFPGELIVVAGVAKVHIALEVHGRWSFIQVELSSGLNPSPEFCSYSICLALYFGSLVCDYAFDHGAAVAVGIIALVAVDLVFVMSNQVDHSVWLGFFSVRCHFVRGGKIESGRWNG
jgi:hypothetical protein